ncbi:uncharacterized protein LOC107048458 [Diachasma alloeum]|uniref:uncharacterized protein LOC107048458 n=1 Tax=Diachasma alloeum TaxID=454923 RepID=UPI0007383D3D|nr:uncharacterized protein LOC107048458 [Diachasma alloeum]
MYVDDLLTGANTIEDALIIRNQITELLQKGNRNIRQWASNDLRLLEGLPEDNINSKLNIETNPILKTLGIHWESQEDIISYTLAKLPEEASMRIILAEIAKIFDPLGLLGPIIVAARLILQECWRQQLEWDQKLPTTIQSAWSEYVTDFNQVQTISYHRGVIPPDTVDLQLHGFADASEKAYGACIYLRCITSSGTIQTKLLCAKSKVAPLQNVVLARLELCAAVMLSQLYETVKERSHIEIPRAFFWSDSTITLHWVNTPSYQLKTFVANRVADIQTKTQVSTWRHVRSEDNPADAISRGQSPSNFINNSLWNYGPAWLSLPGLEWPPSIISSPVDDQEKRKLSCLATCIKGECLDDSFIKTFKTISHLHRVIAKCL